MRQFVGAEARGVVTAHLEASRAERCGAVVFAHDDIVVRRKSALEVGTHGRYEHQQQVFVGGSNAHLCAGADEEGTDVERGARFVGRNEAFVEENDAAHHFAELVRRHFGH